MRNRYFLSSMIFLLVMATGAAMAQSTDDLINQYHSGPSIIGLLITTVVWSAAYLAIYTAALIISLSYLKLFGGFDTEFLIWIGLLWGGGLVINGVMYHNIHAATWVVALCTIPLIFLWNLLISTRSFADLTLTDAARVGVVIALACAPWFHNTWGFETPIKPLVPTTESRTITIPQVAALVPWDTTTFN
ncbi:MAG: hypothetical protein WCJ56_09785 [bacterium]